MHRGMYTQLVVPLTPLLGCLEECGLACRGLPRRGSTASVMSGSVLSGQSSMADAYLLWAGGQQNSSTLGAQPLKDEPQELAETNTVRLYTRS